MDESIWRRDLRDLSRRLSKGETLIVKMKKSYCPEVKNHLQLIGVLEPAYRDSFCDYLPDIDKFALLTDFVDAMIANTLSLERKLKSYRDRKKNEKYIKLNGQIISPELVEQIFDPDFLACNKVYIPEEDFKKCLRNCDEDCNGKKKKNIKTPETKFPTIKAAIEAVVDTEIPSVKAVTEMLEKKCTCKKCKKKEENDPVKEKVDATFSKKVKSSVITLNRPPECKEEKPLVIDLPKSLKKFEKTIIEDIKGHLKFSNNEIVDLINDHLNHDKYSLRRFIVSGYPIYCIICEKDKSTKRFVPETRIEVR